MASSSPKPRLGLPPQPITFDELESGVVQALDKADKEFVRLITGVDALNSVGGIDDTPGCTVSENLDYITLNHTNGDWYGMKEKAQEKP